MYIYADFGNNNLILYGNFMGFPIKKHAPACGEAGGYYGGIKMWS